MSRPRPRSARSPSSAPPRSLGPTHPLTLSARVAHAADLRFMRAPEAARFEEQTLYTLESALGTHTPQTVAARSRTRPYEDFEADVFLTEIP
ncbi:hypothetical protein ACH47Z_05425 [Streptomyces sp. NPDC020192]|uniref:hypothetical protein n=1 Tax=Streptomyces sp. NPDC020192 TaxID=3365066 RepID=UPI00378B003B